MAAQPFSQAVFRIRDQWVELRPAQHPLCFNPPINDTHKILASYSSVRPTTPIPYLPGYAQHHVKDL